MRNAVMSSLNSLYNDNFAEQYFDSRRRQKQKLAEEFAKNVELSFDEQKVSDSVAKLFTGQIPPGTKLEKAKHPTMFAAVQSSFGSEDPRAAAMADIKKNYAEMLRNPETAGMGPNQILAAAYQGTLDLTPSEKVPGASLQDDIHRYFYRKADSGLFPDKTLMPAPGYEEWVEAQRAKPIEEREIGFGAGAGYAVGGTIAARGAGELLKRAGARGLLAGVARGLTAIPWVPSKLVGIALYGGLAATAGDALNNAIRKTDWYRSREDMPVARDLLALAPEIALDVGAGWPLARKATQAVFTKAVERGVVSDAAVKMFHSKPSAEHIIELGKARRLEKEALGALEERLVRGGVDKFEKAALFKHLQESGRDFTETLTARPETGRWFTGAAGVEGAKRRDTTYAYTYLDEMIKRRSNLPVVRPGGDVVPVPPPVQHLGMAFPIEQGMLPRGVVGGRPKQIGMDGGLPPGSPDAIPPMGPSGALTTGITDPLQQGVARDLQGLGPGRQTRLGSSQTGLEPVSLQVGSARHLLELPGDVAEKNLPMLYRTEGDAMRAFQKLSPEDTILAVDQIVGGRPIASAVADIQMNAALRKAIEQTEAAVAVGPKALPPGVVTDAVYEGAEAIAGTAKAAKVAALRKNVTTGPKGDAERLKKAAGEAAVKNRATRAKKLRKSDEAFTSESLVRAPRWSEVIDGTMTPQAYMDEISTPLGRMIEEERVLNYIASKGIPRESAHRHQVFLKWMDDYGRPAIQREAAEAADIAETILPTATLRPMTSAEKVAMRAQIMSERTPAEPTLGSIPNDWVKTMRGLGFVGGMTGLATLADMFGSVEEAEAAVGPLAKAVLGVPKAWLNTAAEYLAIKTMPKAEIHKRHAQLLTEADAAGWVARPVGDSKVLPRRMETPDFASYAAEIYGNLRNAIWREGKLPFGLERIMGTWGRGDIHYKAGANPAVHMAAMQTTWANNTDAAYTVLENIMRDVKGGRTASRDVAARMAPLAEQYQEAVGAWSTIKTKINQLDKADELLKNKVLKDPKLFSKPDVRDRLIEKAEKNLKLRQRLQAALDEVDPQYQQFLKEHEIALKELAGKHASTRVFLAANDTADGQYYPWLKSLLTKEERVAADYVKSMMKTYEETSVSAGLNVITDRPFMHYGWHDKWKTAAGQKWLQDRQLHDIIPTTPYNHFHHRLTGAQPMMPDVWHSIHSYVPIAEKTIGWRKFWTDGGKNSWRNHMRSSTVQNNEALRTLWNSVADAAKPLQRTEVDKWLERYFNFEVFRLLGFSPSVAYKHFFKNIGTWGSLGFKEAASHFGPAATTAFRIKMNSPEVRQMFTKWGMDPKAFTKQFFDDAAASYTKQGKMINILDHMELRPPTQLGWFDNFIGQVNKKAGFQTAAVESYDRVHSFLAASEMAAKRGLTAKDATYGIYDTILKNNFLGGIVNPSWAKSSKVRALMLFQTTAWKILERRIVTGMKAGKAVQEVFKSLKNDTRGWTWDRINSEAQSLKRFVLNGEYEFKKGMITDALATQRDFMGQFAAMQAMREMLYAGIIIGGGAAVGHDYSHHVHHAPFLSSLHDDPTLGLSPIAKATYRTYKDMPYGGEHSEFGIVGDFLNNWFQGNKPIPQMLSKSLNIQKGDVPDRYLDEGFLPKEFRYLWAIPSPKEKEPRRILPDPEAFWSY